MQQLGLSVKRPFARSQPWRLAVYQTLCVLQCKCLLQLSMPQHVEPVILHLSQPESRWLRYMYFSLPRDARRGKHLSKQDSSGLVAPEGMNYSLCIIVKKAHLRTAPIPLDAPVNKTVLPASLDVLSTDIFLDKHPIDDDERTLGEFNCNECLK